MGRNYWIASKNDFIGNTECLRHGITSETCLFGSKGQIWEVNQNSLGVMVYGKFYFEISKLNVICGYPYSSPHRIDEEALFTVPRAHLSDLIKILEVPKMRLGQKAKVGIQDRFWVGVENLSY